MFKPEGYDNTLAYTQNPQLPAGGYVCKVRNIGNYQSKNGNAMWKVMLDIAEGEFRDYFYEKYQRDKQYNAEANYSQNAISYVSLYNDKGQAHRSLKTFCVAIEDSGTSIAWNSNDEITFKSIIGARVGCLFGREEYIGSDGASHWSTKAKMFVPVKDINEGNYKVPDDKYLDQNSYVAQNDITDSFSAADDDIPF